MKYFHSRTRRAAGIWFVGVFSFAFSSVAQSQANSAVSPNSPAGSTSIRSSVSDQHILLWQTQVARDPDYWGSYNQLAAAYAQKARETGDVGYFELAESSLRQSIKLESTHIEAAPAYAQLATVHLAEHRFTEAAEDAATAVRLNPGDLSAYTYAGDAQLELGNYAESKKFYSQVVAQPDGLPHAGTEFLSASHGASLSWIEGDTLRATEELQSAISLSLKLHLPAENIAWTEFMLGQQYLQLGNLTSAEKEENAALSVFPHYHRALAAMGQIRAAQGRFSEAIAFYKDAISLIPLPLYLEALGDVYAALGDPVNAEKQYSVVDFIGKLNAINKQIYNRELALFYADHERKLPEALTLARKELECRHDIYTSDVLAWALLKNGQPEAARGEIERALRLGTQDALLHYHAGMIYSALDDKTNAISHLQRALEINPRFHVLFAQQASGTLARLIAVGSSAKPTQAEAIDANPR